MPAQAGIQSQHRVEHWIPGSRCAPEDDEDCATPRNAVSRVPARVKIAFS